MPFHIPDWNCGTGKRRQKSPPVKRTDINQGLAGAQTHLSGMFALGKGVPKDLVEAYKWANIAAANGSEEGAELLRLTEEQMTPSQIEKARELAVECVNNNYAGC